jgi:hypothetical protein
MPKKKVFVTYDYGTDKHFRQILEGWDDDPEFEFHFCIDPPLDINPDNISRVKAELTARIHSSTHTLVIVGRHANKDDRHARLIGHKNWINFEIFQSRQNQNKIAAVKLHETHEPPDELAKAHVSWATAFQKDDIIRALTEAG